MCISGIGTDCPCPNVSTTPITAMGCQQCLPLSDVQLKGKQCRKPHCRNTFRHNEINVPGQRIRKMKGNLHFQLCKPVKWHFQPVYGIHRCLI